MAVIAHKCEAHNNEYVFGKKSTCPHCKGEKK